MNQTSNNIAHPFYFPLHGSEAKCSMYINAAEIFYSVSFDAFSFVLSIFFSFSYIFLLLLLYLNVYCQLHKRLGAPRQDASRFRMDVTSFFFFVGSFNILIDCRLISWYLFLDTRIWIHFYGTSLLVPNIIRVHWFGLIFQSHASNIFHT